jgi:addiction module HigA family antidote
MLRKLAPLHPGKMVEENLKELDLSVPKAASVLSVSKQHLYRVVRGTNPITPDLAYRIGKLFGNGSRFWLNLQTQYDLFQVEQTYMTDPQKKNIVDNISSYV